MELQGGFGLWCGGWGRGGKDFRDPRLACRVEDLAEWSWCCFRTPSPVCTSYTNGCDISALRAAELRTLRLDDILSDLDMLSSDDVLFTLARSSAPTTTRTHTGEDLLSSFERGSLDASTPQDRRKAYVALSHALVAGSHMQVG